MAKNFLQSNSPLTQGSSPLTQPNPINPSVSTPSQQSPQLPAYNVPLTGGTSPLTQGTSPLTQPTTGLSGYNPNLMTTGQPAQQGGMTTGQPTYTQSQASTNPNSPYYVPPETPGRDNFSMGAVSTQSLPVVSTTPVQEQYNGLSQQLNEIAVEEDPYMAIFEQMNELNKQTEQNAIANASAASANEKFALQGSQDEYMGQLMSAGQTSGRSRYLREYQAGILETARQSYISKFRQIDNAEKLAIAEANTARMTGNVQVMQEKLDYINALRKAKADALAEANKLEWEKEKFNRQMAQDESQFNRRLSLDWTKFNAKDDEEETTDEERTQTQVFSPKKKQTTKLSVKGVPQTVVNAIEDLVAQGYAFEEAFAELPIEVQQSISQGARNVLKKSIKDI